MDVGILNYGPVVVFRWESKKQWTVIEVTKNVGHILGYSHQQFLESDVIFEEIIHPYDLEKVKQQIQEFSDAAVLHFNISPFRIFKPSGEIIWVDVYVTVIRNKKGKITHYVGYISDITQRIKDEKALRETTDRYHAIVEATQEGVWDWDMRTNTVYFSKRWKSMLGFEEDEIGTGLDEWESRVHPDDLLGCYRSLNAHLKGSTQIYSCVHRVMHKKGHFLWILDRGKKVLDKNGRPYRIVGTHKDITEEIELKRKLEKMATHDDLTGLLKRNEFEKLAKTEIQRSIRSGHHFSILIIDLDDFKRINDTYGHLAGDKVLKKVAKTLQKNIRIYDLICRYGGEEFMAILTEISCAEAWEQGERMRKSVEELKFQFSKIDNGPPEEVSIHISVGIAQHVSEQKLEDTIHRADQQLYEAKKKGKNLVLSSDCAELNKKNMSESEQKIAQYLQHQKN